MPSRIGTISLALILGFASTTAQVMVIRELLVAFTGNELTIAVTLAIWLLAVGFGSLVAGRRASSAGYSLPALMIIAGLVCVIQVISIRLVLPLVAGAGELVTPTAILVLSGAGILPGAILFGALFVGLAARAGSAGLARPIASIYGAEAGGSALSGLALGTYLLEAVNPVAVMTGAAMLCLASGGYLLLAMPSPARGIKAALAAGCLAGLAVVLAASGKIDIATRQVQWQPLNVVRAADSRYGNIVVTGRDSIFQFFENGTLAFTVPDLRYAEECAHLPLLHHPEPQAVLVLGGAGSGIIHEILGHPSVTRVDFVELDPAVVSMVREFAPRGWLEGSDRASVDGYFGDGRERVAKSGGTYDVVIVSVGMPTTLQTNRYYTREFFRSARERLRQDGILAVKVASPGALVGPETAALAASIKNALGAVFPNLVMLPGDYIHILASPGLNLKAQTPLVLERLESRGLRPSFVNQFVLWDRLAPIRLAELDSVVASGDRGQVNSDDRPVALALALSLWEKQMAGRHRLSSFAARLDFARCILLLLVLGSVVVGLSAAVCRLPIRALPPLVMIYLAGLATMFTQVLVILAFQIASGYIYGKIAAVIAAYMAGTGLAAAVAARRLPSPGPALTIGLGSLLAVPPLSVPLVLHLAASHPHSLPGWATDVLFVGVSALTGYLGGAVFAAASAALAAEREIRSRAAALAYSMDLAGASIAAFLTGLVVIPALGILRSACAISAVSLVASVLAVIAAWASSRPRPR
jgi:spermidine synthase